MLHTYTNTRTKSLQTIEYNKKVSVKAQQSIYTKFGLERKKTREYMCIHNE